MPALPIVSLVLEHNALRGRLDTKMAVTASAYVLLAYREGATVCGGLLRFAKKPGKCIDFLDRDRRESQDDHVSVVPNQLPGTD
jgi:hypothetical protein